MNKKYEDWLWKNNEVMNAYRRDNKHTDGSDFSAFTVYADFVFELLDKAVPELIGTVTRLQAENKKLLSQGSTVKKPVQERKLPGEARVTTYKQAEPGKSVAPIINLLTGRHFNITLVHQARIVMVGMKPWKNKKGEQEYLHYTVVLHTLPSNCHPTDRELVLCTLSGPKWSEAKKEYYLPKDKQIGEWKTVQGALDGLKAVL